MFNVLPKDPSIFINWSWPQFKPYYDELHALELDENNIDQFLSDWTRLIDLVSEIYARLSVAVTLDTTDKNAEKRYNQFLEGLYPAAQSANQQLKLKLLDSGLDPAGFQVPLKKMRAEASIFRQENLPLLTEERKLGQEYNKIIGAQTIKWNGDELTLQQLRPLMLNDDRGKREKIWRKISERQLADRHQINELWAKQVETRLQLARNADMPDYRAYRWKQMTRVDYTPDDCIRFQQAIEEVVVPAATRVYEKHRQKLGLERLRPWDLDLEIYPIRLPPISHYGTVADLQQKAGDVFTKIDPRLGEYFKLMREEQLLDLENHKGKAPGAYCTNFPVTQRPFIFMNAVGVATDVRTILHESGHAFHNFERFQLPYAQQRNPGLEFAEVASMGLELLASRYLGENDGGFYSENDEAEFRIQHLERILTFWPYMAVVDAFQHWVYTHDAAVTNPANCDAKWYELWLRFIPGVDWSGFEPEAMTGWHRKQHIHRAPFYYVEYGLAQLGAVQIWKKSLKDHPGAVSSYLDGLRLGGTASLPELYRTSGANFAFDSKTLNESVKLIEKTIQKLESG